MVRSLPFSLFLKNILNIKKFLLTNGYVLCIINADAFDEVLKFSNGRIAQLGEHLPYKQRVIGSSPIVPTKLNFITVRAFDVGA